MKEDVCIMHHHETSQLARIHKMHNARIFLHLMFLFYPHHALLCCYMSWVHAEVNMGTGFSVHQFMYWKESTAYPLLSTVYWQVSLYWNDRTLLDRFTINEWSQTSICSYFLCHWPFIVLRGQSLTSVNNYQHWVECVDTIIGIQYWLVCTS